MNEEFLSRAQKITSFNLTTHDFKTLDHKAEIQHLFQTHFFPSFDVSRTIKKVDGDHLNDLIAELKHGNDGEMFPKLHSYNLRGVGPGEVTMFFLVQPALIGGGGSAGIDIFVDSDLYEVKAALISKSRAATDFSVGSSVPLADLMVEMNNLQRALGLGNTTTSIKGSIVNKMRQMAPLKFNEIENHYRDVTYEYYFKHHDTIFINNNKEDPRFGIVEAVKAVQKEDITIERLTKGTIKPRVQL
jgi:hypothetical protein